MEEIQTAWAAGLFEGEGNIWLKPAKGSGKGRKGRFGTLRLRVGMTDEDVVRRFQSVVNCGRVYEEPPRGKGTKQFFVWEAWGRNAENVLHRLSPYFGSRRLNKTNEILTIWRP